MQPTQNNIGLRVLDYTVQNNDKVSLPAKETRNTLRKIYLVGQTRLTNAQFADPTSGKGLVLDVWAKNPKWVQGSNCCNQLVQNLVKKLGLNSPKEFNTYVTNAKEYAALKLFPLTREGLPLYLDTVTQWGKSGTNDQIEFDTSDVKNPKLVKAVAPVDESGYLPDTAVPSQQILNRPFSPPGLPELLPPSPFSDIQLFKESSGQAATAEGDGTPSSKGHASSDFVGSIDANGNSAATLTSVRAGGVVQDVVIVLEDAAKAAGIAGLAVAPVFIILDFAHGNPVGGAFGAVGLFLGVLAATAVSGPVGWLVGGLAALFSILPSFFNKPASDPPHAENATEIIQYAMFGDIHHTGNEKCRLQNPNCTALYGPGVLSLAFKWDNFDPIAFLLQYNAGFAMTIPEIATAFYLIDPSKPNDGADKAATITCNPPTRVCNRFNCPGVKKKICGTATFSLNRPLITIPVLNQTADKIYNRIIPKPHGDCKLINDVAGTHYSDYNLTITGSPVAIACGVTASLNVSGVVSLINDTDANNGLPAAFNSPANKSTDGSVHEVAAPSPIGFSLNNLNATNSVCLAGSGGSMCFPNGTYDIQKGTFGFDSSKVDSLSIAPGASLTFTAPATGKPHQALSLETSTYKSDQPATNNAFRKAFGAIAASALGPRTFNALMPAGNDGPPTACLFSLPQFHGDVTCYGEGSGNVSANVAGVPQSITLHGNASAWVYGKYYGDDGGQRITMNTPDLTAVPLGADDNFNKKIKALWVAGPG